jgi:formylglycine-generating enzyme required for sulfatase activity
MKDLPALPRVWVAAALASGCFNPDLATKPCVDRTGCPEDYYCVAGLCSLTPPEKPKVAEVRLDPSQRPMFLMGRSAMEDPDWRGNDTPAHVRTVTRPYYLDEREVTVASYELCVQADVCQPARTDNPRCNYGKPEKATHPINCVDYARAEAYCRWLSRRLPTETEWEYAARDVGIDAMYSFGMTWDATRACFNVGSTCSVAGVGVRTFQGKIVPPTAPGFYDLTGNVWEWTQSEFCPYTAMSAEGQTCGSTRRVVRGGSGFDTDVRAAAVFVRFGNQKAEVFNYASTTDTGGHYNLGFRCARD